VVKDPKCLAKSYSIVVDHLTTHPEVEGSDPATAEHRYKNGQWVETNPANIRFFPTDIRFYLASWYYDNGLWMSVHECLRMLYGFVSSNPKTVVKKALEFQPPEGLEVSVV